MRESRGQPDLAQKSIAAERRGEVGVKCLDRDVTTVLDVVREIHRRHAAGPELAGDAVSVGERFGELVGSETQQVGGKRRENVALDAPSVQNAAPSTDGLSFNVRLEVRVASRRHVTRDRRASRDAWPSLGA